MLRLDINLVFTIINLLIWYAIIRIFLFKPINKVIDKRNAAIQEKYDEAKKMQEEAQAEKEKYAACQDEIEVEKNKVLDAARASAREEGRQLIENAQKEADKVIRKRARMHAGRRTRCSNSRSMKFCRWFWTRRLVR